MSLFDEEAAHDRSLRRFERAVRGGRNGRLAENSWWGDHLSIRDIAAVVDWCAGKGLRVEFVKRANAVFDRNTMTISIASNVRPPRQLIYLLHECGHYMISTTAAKDDRFKMGYALGDGFTTERGFPHKLACVEEEFEAWHRGWRLSRRLKLGIKREQFDAVRRTCLRTYMAWGVKSGK